MSCNKRHKACLCQKYPRHSRQKCDKICNYCSFDDNALLAPRHTIDACPRGCHYCLKPATELVDARSSQRWRTENVRNAQKAHTTSRSSTVYAR
ncbi:hypothetical protein F5B17DRAFT_32530 [Nemania serpens]|nr:hypothetical protein F5B17DRAFT_32530 [Nemania serpens]